MINKDFIITNLSELVLANKKKYTMRLVVNWVQNINNIKNYILLNTLKFLVKKCFASVL